MTRRVIFLYDYVFGNIVLPNALAPEMAIINYIHSLYSSKLDRQSLFDVNFDDENSPFRGIFGTELGHMPSVIFNNGTYLHSECFREKLDIEEHAMHFGERKYPKYIYPIKLTLHFDKFTGVDHVGSKLNGEFFWKNISAEALKHIRGRRATIFLDWSNENFIERNEYLNLHHALKYSGIPPSQVLLTVNSFNAQEIYESWFSPEERLLEVRNLPFLLNNISHYYKTHPESRVDERDHENSRTVIRKNYFVYPIRRCRDHRLALLYKMTHDGSLNLGDWSCLDPRDPGHITAIAQNYAMPIDQNLSNWLAKNLPHSLESEQGSTYNSVAGWNDQHSRAFSDSYFYVASETYTHGPYKSLTEKVFKPLANYQPFLFLAYPGALQVLRDIGFKTFNGWIDESYDNEQDLVRRVNLISNEIKRLCSMSKEEIHNWYWSMNDVLTHNRNHLFNLYQNEPHAEKLIEELYQRTVQ